MDYITKKEYIFYNNKRLKLLSKALEIYNENTDAYNMLNNNKTSCEDLIKLYQSYPDDYQILKPIQWQEYKDILDKHYG